MICVDASLVLSWLLPEDLSEKAIALKQGWDRSGETLISSRLLVMEVTSVLRSAVYRRRITEEEGNEAFESFLGLPIRYPESDGLAIRAWEAARRMQSARAYDMFYLALAEAQGCELWTNDLRLSRLVAGYTSSVRWVGNADSDANI